MSEKNKEKTKKESNLWSGSSSCPPVDYYVQAVKLPIVVIVLLEIILIIFTERYWYDIFWWQDYNSYILILLKVLIAFWVAQSVYKSLRKKTSVVAPAYTTGAMAGFLAGLLIAIFKIFWYHKFWTFFNLISEPLIMTLAGAFLVRWFAGFLDKMFKHN